MNAINNDPIQLLDAGLDQANIQTYDQQQNLDLQVREEHHIEAIKDELDDALTGKTEPETFLSNLSIASTQQNLDIHSAATSTSEVGLNEPTASDKASTFCQIMRHADAPMNFRLQVLSRLIQWRLLDPSADYSEISDNAEFNRIMNEARKNAATAGPEFLAAFQKAPWNFDESIEGIYADDELTTMFPIGVELKSILGDTTRFTFRCEPGSYYLRLIETADGKKKILRTLDTERPAEDINTDAQRAPSIIPRFEAIRFSDGKTGLLIDWIEGEMPSTPEEKAQCAERAAELLDVPMEQYDLWAGNFLVAREPADDGQSRVFYIDRDIPETIAQKGLSPDTAIERQALLEHALQKLL